MQVSVEVPEVSIQEGGKGDFLFEPTDSEAVTTAEGHVVVLEESEAASPADVLTTGTPGSECSS